MTRNTIGWVPLRGNFDAEGDQVVFRGTDVPEDSVADSLGTQQAQNLTFGMALSSESLADGDVSAEVELDEVTDDSVCEILLAYDPGARHMIAAGLGGDRLAMFTVREFGGSDPPGWTYHNVGGTRSALRPKRKYLIHASFRGALVTLSIDNVPVATSRVSSPQGQRRQVGIFCKGAHKITVRNFKVAAQKPKAFIVMQFGGEYDEVYSDVVKGVCEAYDVSSLRADDVVGPGLIIADIIREITTAQLIIADITPANPNVYFEVGYGLALNKPTILLARRGTALPFDLAGFRVLFYENSIGGKGKLETGLERHIAAILGKSSA